MLTPWEIAEALPSVEYKGWVIAPEQDEFHGMHLSFFYTEPDNFDSTKNIDIYFRTKVPPIPDLDYLWKFVYKRIEEAEVHETRERFKVNGVAIFDPHAVAA